MESDYLEVETTSESRTLVIPFFADDEVIDIIGTTVLTSEPVVVTIPSWIKSNAQAWSMDIIDADTFAGSSTASVPTKSRIQCVPDLLFPSVP